MAKFTTEEINLAKKVQEKYGVPASVTLGQYALESGYGKSTVGKNNYFNIKGNGTGGYRDYASKEESFMDFGKLLTNDRYTSKTDGAKTVQEYVEGVKAGGYAEDPKYVSKVMSIIKANDLEKYDTGNYQTTDTITIKKSGVDVTWWGDIVIVVFALILIVGGVVFVGISVTSNNAGNSLINNIKKVKGAKK